VLKGFLCGAIYPEKNKDISGLGSKQKLKDAKYCQLRTVCTV